MLKMTDFSVKKQRFPLSGTREAWVGSAIYNRFRGLYILQTIYTIICVRYHIINTVLRIVVGAIH